MGDLDDLLQELEAYLPDANRFLRQDMRTVQWRNDAPYALDVVEFEEALRRADREADRVAVSICPANFAGRSLTGGPDRPLAERAASKS